MDEETKRRITEIRAREQKATEGEWRFDPVLDGMIEGPRGGAIAFTAHHASTRTISQTGEEYNHADAEFIAHARQDVPFLLDALEKAHAEIERTTQILANNYADQFRG